MYYHGMGSKNYKEYFYNEGLKYLAELTPTGEFSFRLVSGSSPKGTTTGRNSRDLFPEDSGYGDVNLNRAGLVVFIKAKEILVKWVYEHKPWKISFTGSTARKAKVYKWMAVRLAKSLPDYMMVEYPDNVFNLYITNNE